MIPIQPITNINIPTLRTYISKSITSNTKDSVLSLKYKPELGPLCSMLHLWTRGCCGTTTSSGSSNWIGLIKRQRRIKLLWFQTFLGWRTKNLVNRKMKRVNQMFYVRNLNWNQKWIKNQIDQVVKPGILMLLSRLGVKQKLKKIVMMRKTQKMLM